ncbi:MucB/RseB C-terminal domain-containing protein [Tepidimonas taiwanensis]|uniref:MucB/RseB C-terminal domain-containing protein n=1 Tax=Tepidimonas taiwanensis TaxID=307486 RepID=UPI0007345A5D|nr:MucB/RseB C-terminal domain-containing protein [Tepidimonas taiwanensis]
MSLTSSLRHLFRAVAGVVAAALFAWPGAMALAQAVPSNGAPPADVRGWLQRLHDATRNRAYSGVFVVTRGSEIATARIAHVCDGRQQVERIESLSGPARVTWRRDDEVLTVWPERQWALRDRRELLRLFPGPVGVPGIEVGGYYRAEPRGSERVAGYDAWVVDIVPADALRYGYRLWSEKRTGLALKVQTLRADGEVLEQVAFTELQLDAPLRLETLARQMDDTRGMRVERPVLNKTTLEAEGWRLRAEVPGFRPVTCWSRPAEAGRTRAPLQCVFSDGLAAVSLFFSAGEAAASQRAQAGATHVLVQSVAGTPVTAMGEVPLATLERFLGALEKTR